MISCIICSRNPDISAELRNNIDTTIGCDHEIVVIDNSRNQYSIFSAYNEGVRRAKGEFLCFMHDDLFFVTQHWGELVNQLFSDNTDMGVLGFAGTHFLPKVPQYWWSSPFISEHNLTNGEQCFGWMYPEKNMVDVVACDGMCMFIRKELFDKISFDEEHYSGFHLYDMDICMQVQNTGYRVCVSREILADHHWHEQYKNAALEHDLEIFYEKWSNSLPMNRGLENIPPFVLDRLNSLCQSACDAKQVRKSKAYKMGYILLHPLSVFKSGK